VTSPGTSRAQQRRAAARISAYFAGADDLATLLAVAEHGVERLFDGSCTILIELDGPTSSAT
jgi:hypothetical protein